MKRTFACIQYPSYAVRNHKFHDGLLTTEDPEVIRLIEGCDGYGQFIHPTETIEELAAMKEREETKPKLIDSSKEEAGEGLKDWPVPSEEDPPIATQGARGTASGKQQRKGELITPKK